MLPASIGIFNQSAAPTPFQFNPAYDLISSDNAGVLGPKLSSYDGVLLPALLPTDPFFSNPNEIVVMPLGNLIQVPAGQQVADCTMVIEKTAVAGTAHEIRTIPEVTPTMALGFCDHVMWTINGNVNTHQARGGAGPPAGAGDPTLTQHPEEEDEGGGGGGGGLPEEDPEDPFGGGLGGGGFGGGFPPPEEEDPIGGGGGGGAPVSGGNSTTVDLLPLMNGTTGDITTPLFWQWFAQGARGNITLGATTGMKCRLTASSTGGAKINLDLTWVAK